MYHSPLHNVSFCRSFGTKQTPHAPELLLLSVEIQTTDVHFELEVERGKIQPVDIYADIPKLMFSSLFSNPVYSSELRRRLPHICYRIPFKSPPCRGLLFDDTATRKTANSIERIREGRKKTGRTELFERHLQQGPNVRKEECIL
jgi:hypothetical protein